jgi:hypothetical protein
VVISLQYADETLLFIENNFDSSRNIKWLLSVYEQLSGMIINFSKCDLVHINIPDEQINVLAQVFGCKVSSFLLKYLGVQLRKEDLQPIIDQILKMAGGWRGRLLSYVARIILIKSCLVCIPIYLLSVIKFPAWAIRAINSQMSHCLWDKYEGHNKYHLGN